MKVWRERIFNEEVGGEWWGDHAFHFYAIVYLIFALQKIFVYLEVFGVSLYYLRPSSNISSHIIEQKLYTILEHNFVQLFWKVHARYQATKLRARK